MQTIPDERVMELARIAEQYPTANEVVDSNAAYRDVALLLRELLERRSGGKATKRTYSILKAYAYGEKQEFSLVESDLATRDMTMKRAKQLRAVSVAKNGPSEADHYYAAILEEV